MSLDKIIVTLAGIVGILFTYWFFLMKKDQAVQVTGDVAIKVDGGYTPDHITIQRGKSTTLTFFRTDPSTCLEEVVLPDFKIRTFLPLNKKTPITITPNKIGTFDIVCGMNMFHGKITVI